MASEWHPKGIRTVSEGYPQRFPARSSASASSSGWLDGMASTRRQAEYGAVRLVWRPVLLPWTRLRKPRFSGAKRERRRAPGPRGALLAGEGRLSCPAMTGSTATDSYRFRSVPSLRALSLGFLYAGHSGIGTAPSPCPSPHRRGRGCRRRERGQCMGSERGLVRGILSAGARA